MDLPEDMDSTLRMQLKTDQSVFGTCYYAETEDGYERIEPQEAFKELGG